MNHNNRISAYMRDRFDLPGDWHVKSIDNIENGALIHGCQAPLSTRGQQQGQPNFRSKSGEVRQFFLSRAEVRLAISGKPAPEGLDYQCGHCAEYAIALYTLLKAQGIEGHKLRCAHGERYDDDDDDDRLTVNIHCVVLLADGTEVDSEGIRSDGGLDGIVENWHEIHQGAEPESDLVSYANVAEMILNFEETGLRIYPPAIAIAARDILNSVHYWKLVESL